MSSFSHDQPTLSDIALLNALIVRYDGGELLPQAENAAFLQAIQDCAAALRLVRCDHRPPLTAIAAWHLAVEDTSGEIARLVWDRYFCQHFTDGELAQIAAVKDRLRRQLPLPDFPAARRVYLDQLRASLRLEDLDGGPPYSLPPGVSGERRAQIVTRASFEVLRARHRAGLLSDDDLRRHVETFWPAAGGGAGRGPRSQEEPTLLDFLKQFVTQTEAARRQGGGPRLSEETWAWKVWLYLEDSEQHHTWLRRRLAELIPAASARRRSPRGARPRRSPLAAPPGPDLRCGLIRFFRLESLLVPSPGTGAGEGGGEGSHLHLNGEEIRRVARVEALLTALSPDASPLLPPAVYALPLLRVLREAINALSSGAGSPPGRRALRILARLAAYYEDYDPSAPLLRFPTLGKTPVNAVARWKQFLRDLGDKSEHFRQRTVQLQLLRALSVAITPDQSEAARRLCASSSLRRQLDTERIGLGQRCRGDSHTELGTMALKLSGRAAQLRSLVSRRSYPPSTLAAARELLEAAAEMAHRALADEANSEIVAFEIRSLFDHTIRPGHGRLEVAVESIAPEPGDKELRRKLDALREAAARLLWTAEDLTDGFFRGRRNVGLRWLVGRRSGERENDLFSPD